MRTSRAGTGRWRVCGGCGHERRLADGTVVLGIHNRWDPGAQMMVPCPGSGQPPMPAETAALVSAGGA